MHANQRHEVGPSESDSGSETEQELIRLFRAWPDADQNKALKQTQRLMGLHKKRRSARKRLTNDLAEARQTIANFDEDKKKAVAQAYNESEHARKELSTSLQRADETIRKLRKKKKALHKELDALHEENKKLRGASKAKSSGSVRATSPKSYAAFPSTVQFPTATPPVRVAEAAAAHTPALFASPHTPLRASRAAAANNSLSPEQLQAAMSSMMSSMMANALSAAGGLAFAQGAPVPMDYQQPPTQTFTPSTSTVRSGSSSRASSSRGTVAPEEGRSKKRQPTPEGFRYTGVPAPPKDHRCTLTCVGCQKTIRNAQDRIMSHRQNCKGAAAAASRGDPHADSSSD